MAAAFTFYIRTYHWPVLSVTGQEALSEPFLFNVILLMPAQVSLDFLLAQEARLVMATRTIAGVVNRIQRIGLHSDGRQRVMLDLVPCLDLLKLQRGAKVFVKQSVVEIVKALLQKHGYSYWQIGLELDDTYPKKDYILQVSGESDFAFIQRILAKAGIHYRLFAKGKYEHIILSDHNDSAAEAISYIPASLMTNDESKTGLYQLSIHQASVAQRIRVSDHHEDFPEGLFEAYAQQDDELKNI